MSYEITRGLLGLEAPTLFGKLNLLPYYWLGLGLVLVSFYLTYKILNSNVGLYIRAIRDDEDIAEFMGVNTVKMKCIISTIASLLAGIAGAFYAFYIGLITPALADFNLMGMILYMVILGGSGTLVGPLIGCLTIMWIWEFFREYQVLWMILFATIVIIIMKFMRGGIAGLICELSNRYLKNENVKNKIIKLFSI
jgi:branched-chain amino acid transport system permease protein